jgi:hypothetical protein
MADKRSKTCFAAGRTDVTDQGRDGARSVDPLQ